MSASAVVAAPEIVFRVDGGSAIGSGHVVRCLTLASELRRRAASIRFVCREEPGNLIGQIERNGYVVERLRSAPDMWVNAPDERVSPELIRRDADETLAVIRKRPAWLIVDHYSLDDSWEASVRPAVERILAIDDFIDRRHECDVLLNQNWLGDTVRVGGVPEACRILLGPRFALLHSEYAHVRAVLPARDGTLRRLLVFFGGTDSSDETDKVIDAVASDELPDVAIDVVIGRNHPNRARIVSKIARRPGASLHEGLPSLAGLIARADLVVGAGGTSTWERLCLDAPAIVTTVASNQEPTISALAAAGYVRWIGRASEVPVERYRQEICAPLQVRSHLAPLVDGFGTKRVAELLLRRSAEFRNLRVARPSDAALFFDWRNDPTTRAMSFSTAAISWNEHLEWFKRRLDDAETTLYVAELDGLPIGQVRLDFGSSHTTLSYSLDHLVRGRSWSGWMITEALREIRRTSDKAVVAEVKRENIPSIKVFERLGWRQVAAGADGRLTFRFEG